MRLYEVILKPYPLFLLLFLVAPTVLYLECEAAELRLAWLDNSTDEDGFNIDRKTRITGTYTTIAFVAPDITTYTDAGLLDDTEYCYRVYAFNAAEISPFSNEACGTTPPAAVFANSVSVNIADGVVLSGTSVVWTATPTGVPAGVQFLIDGMLRWTEYRSIYQFNGDPSGTLDTTTLNNGSHELTVRAVYADGAVAEKTVSVTVLNRSVQQLSAKIGVFRPSTGEWFLDLDGNRAFDGCAIDICVTNFGASGMRPVVGDWHGTGKTNIGVYDPQTGTWHLDDGNGTRDDCESGVDLCIASFGAPGSYPVTKILSDTDQIVIGFFQRTVTEIVNGTTVTKLGLWNLTSMATVLWTAAISTNVSKILASPGICQSSGIGTAPGIALEFFDPKPENGFSISTTMDRGTTHLSIDCLARLGKSEIGPSSATGMTPELFESVFSGQARDSGSWT